MGKGQWGNGQLQLLQVIRLILASFTPSFFATASYKLDVQVDQYEKSRPREHSPEESPPRARQQGPLELLQPVI